MPLDPDQTNAGEKLKVWLTGCFATLMAIAMAFVAWATVFILKREKSVGHKPPTDPFDQA